MNVTDMVKFAIADLVGRQIQQQGFSGVFQHPVEFTKSVWKGAGATVGKGPQSYTAALAGIEQLGEAAAAAASAVSSLSNAVGKGLAPGGGPGGGGSSSLKNFLNPPGSTKPQIPKGEVPQMGDLAKAGMGAAKAGAGGTEGAVVQVAGEVAEVGEALALLSNPITLTAVAVGETALAFLGITQGIVDFGEAAVEANKHLGQWSGTLAIANAKYDIQTTRLEQQTAAATGGSASVVTESQMSLREEFQPVAEDLQIIKNLCSTAVIDFGRLLAQILRGVDLVVGPLLRAIDWAMGQGKTVDLPMKSLFDFFRSQNFLPNDQVNWQIRHDKLHRDVQAKAKREEQRNRGLGARRGREELMGDPDNW